MGLQHGTKPTDIVREALEHLGAEPTAVTPCADHLAGVKGTGLVQVVTARIRRAVRAAGLKHGRASWRTAFGRDVNGSVGSAEDRPCRSKYAALPSGSWSVVRQKYVQIVQSLLS